MTSQTPVIMHVDMDCFYASVALRRRPELRGTPVIVGGAGRGVVLSATYEARAAGVHSAMPMSRARRLCPSAVVLPPDMDAFHAASKGIFAIFDSITSVVEGASVDEAFLDITGSLRRLGGARAIGELVRAQVTDEQQITCSVGIGPTKFIAKVASTQAKPDGLIEVRPDDVVAFLHPLPVERMWGVGEATAEKLHRLGLRSVADLAHTSRQTLQRAFGPRQGILLADLAWGRDGRRVVGRAPERSVSSEETFGTDTDDARVIAREILRMSARTAGRLRRAGVLGRTVALTLRFADFSTITRSATLRNPTDVTDEIHEQAMSLYRKLGLQRIRIRKVGVRVENLVDIEQAYRQPELTDPERGWREAEVAVDAAVRKFGPAAVQRAALTRNPDGRAEGDQWDGGRRRSSG